MLRGNEENYTKMLVVNSSTRDSSLWGTSQRLSVSFDDQLTVRCYPTVLGDNPSVKEGPPVAIGWEFTTERHSLTQTPKSRNKRNQYRLDARTRVERLRKNGVSQQEMDFASYEIQLLQRLRWIHAAF